MLVTPSDFTLGGLGREEFVRKRHQPLAGQREPNSPLKGWPAQTAQRLAAA